MQTPYQKMKEETPYDDKAVAYAVKVGTVEDREIDRTEGGIPYPDQDFEHGHNANNDQRNKQLKNAGITKE